ncbi:MAG: LTA synthase family protein [Clostridia bacterium]|nr:LTA synthase family protein [Clostridia bacterium]
MKKSIRKPDWAALLVFASLILTVMLEALSRHSIAGSFQYIVTHPWRFLFNALIVLDTLAISAFFRRRMFVFCTVSLLWLVCGVANCVMVSFRTLPFTIIDLTLLKDAIKLFDVYFNLFQRILICVAGVAVVALILFLFIKAPRISAVPLRSAFGSAVMLATLTIACINLGMNTQSLTLSLGNLTSAYQDYGFAYCFLVTFVDVGIDRPEDYSEQAIEEIQEQIESVSSDANQLFLIHPNVVYVQLESLFDPKHIEGLELKEDPLPTFTQLKNDYPSGYLTMPSVGGGTANSEFEVLTGMTLSHFGAGEYPYNTVLKDLAAESICYNLSNVGYTSHAIHNHSGSFYSRNLIYPHLGFDTFTPLEYMNNVELNSLGWAKDNVLTGQIVRALQSTEGSDFVFCVTVQSHGHYPTEQVVAEEDSLIEKLDADNVNRCGLDYYVREIRDVDAFIADLIQELEASDEPTIVVFYGDHLPSLGLTDDDLENGSIYQTEYIIWNNYSSLLRHIADRDLSAYQLSAYITDLLKIHEGEICRFHQSHLEDDTATGEEYLEKLKILEYDMLYGDRTIYGGEDYYVPTAMTMGVAPITLTGMYVSDGALVVTGSGFTSFSEVFFDDQQISTIFVSPQILVATEVPGDGRQISVGQVTDDHAILSSANPLMYQAAK